MERSDQAPARRTPDTGPTRRSFLRSAMFATVGSFFASSATGAAAMVWPIKSAGFGSLVTVPKPVSEIKVGEVLAVREGKFYLIRTEDGLMALHWKCVHLGCVVPWNEQAGLFLCPCHQSTYQITGQNIAGPAPRPLDYMDMRLQGDQIVVDTGKIRQRTSYDPAQALKVE